jgi:DNA-binding LacI/PurR family transcriptional regulator
MDPGGNVATRADVARRAGVSPSTVTYALNGERPSAEATRQRILAAMAELGYSPNAMAAGLAGGRSRIIAMLFPTLERGYSDSDLEYLVGAADAAHELNHRVLLWTMDREDIPEVARLCRSGLVEGLLLMEVRMQDERVDYLRREGIPLALIGRTADDASLPYADRDFTRVGQMAVSHLAGLGHTDIAFLGPPERLRTWGFGAVVRAINGIEKAARASGVRLITVDCEATVPAGRDALLNLRQAHPEVTGIISFNDEGAIGLYQGAQAMGLRIPTDLSVISTSVSTQRTAFFFPALTTISPPAGAIGGAAARALIHALENPDAAPEQSLLTGELVERGSTAPPTRPRARKVGQSI